MNRLILISLAFLMSASVQAQTSLSLEDCRGMALRNDPKVKNARLDVLAARAQKQEALAEYFPSVSLNSFGFMALDPMLEIGIKDIIGESDFSNNVQTAISQAASQYGFSPVFTAFKSGFSASVSAMQPIYAGGRIVAGNRLAALGLEASEAQDELTSRDVLETVDKGYWQVVALEEKMATLEASEAFVDNLARDVAAAVGAGLALDTDLMQVELKRNELKGLRMSLTGGIRLAKMNLFNAIGQQYCLIPEVADSLKPYIDDIVLSERLSDLKPPQDYYRPEEEIVAGLSEAKLLDMSVEAKRLEKRMALGEALPQIGIGASYGYTHALDSRFNGVAFAMVKIPISDWGKVSRKVQRIDYSMQKARNDRDYLSGQLLLQVRSLWLDLTVAWENVAIARDNMELARRTAARMEEQYGAGLVPLSELLQARTQLRTHTDACLDAQIAYSAALTAYLLRQ